jgi:ELWxxDGT repeat protein
MGKNVPFYKGDFWNAFKNLAHGGFLSLSMFFILERAVAQSTLIEDLNRDENSEVNEFSNLRAADGKVYFVIEDKDLYVNISRSEVEDQTIKLHSFLSITNLTLVGNTLYFSANDDTHGIELWKSDGTEAGTVLVKDIYPGSASGLPEQLTNVNGTLYFTAILSSTGKELFKSNGTSGGTVLVKDIFPKKGSSNPRYLTTVGTQLYFSANDGINGYELWKSDGTSSGTVLVKDIKTGSKISSSPESLVNVNGIVFFTASESATGRELYKSDGTVAGTALVKDIRPGTSSSGIENMTSVNSTLFFSANDGSYGHELWKSDGTLSGTILVKDMTPGGAGSHGEQAFMHRVANFTNINGLLFYTAYQNDTYYVWKSDGTTAGTIPLFIARGPGIGQPRPQFTLMDGSIYFFNADDPYDETMYSLQQMTLSGTSVTSVYPFYVDTYGYYYPEIVVTNDDAGNNHLYFNVAPVWSGMKLIKSDGTEEGTVPLYDQDPYRPTDSSNPHSFINWNGKIVFIAQTTFYESESIIITDGNSTNELVNFNHMSRDIEVSPTKIYGSGRDWFEIYVTDGTSWGHELVNDWESGPASNLTAVNGGVFFTTADGKLWRINEATEEMTVLKSIPSMSELKPLGTNVILRSRNANQGEELWRSDGTVSGTYRFETVSNSATTYSLYYPSVTIKNTHFFVANDGIHGNEIWRTQGSGASTYMISDLNPNDEVSMVYRNEYDISSFGAFRDSLYFSAIGADGTWALHKSNGRAEGIRKVMDMNAVKTMVPVGNKLYLFTYGPDNRTGLQLWVTNGTASGTKFLKELSTSGYVAPQVVNGILYFNIGDFQLWRSDGTECGTYSFDVGVSQPGGLIALNNNLIFSGYEASVGQEPFKMPISSVPNIPCAATFVENSAKDSDANKEVFSTYPNPFMNDFALRISGKDDERTSIQVTTTTGFPVEHFEDLSSGDELTLGQSWPVGMYIVKVTRGSKTVTNIVVKK